jgi:hypothetical protein
MFCDPTQYPTQRPVLESIQCHSTTTIVLEGDDTIHIGILPQQILTKMLGDGPGDTR